MNAKKSQDGFTLIELLIVIGLLGGLVALVLPRLSASRTQALGQVCTYNKAGTIRVLMKYKDLFDKYPADLHNGLQGTGATAFAMQGMPSPLTAKMGDGTVVSPSIHALTAGQATSLTSAGITSVCSGGGLNSVAVAEDVNMAIACAADGSDFWTHAGGEMHFDGIDISDWAAGTAGPGWNTTGGAGPVVVLWIAPTVDWAAGNGGNADWTKGSVEYGVSLEGKCPVPRSSTSGGDIEFNYYIGYFKVFNDGTPAQLIGTTCAGCGPINP